MASVPSPDTGPIETPSPQPSVPQPEVGPMPDDFDQPAPMGEPTPDGPGYQATMGIE